MTVMELCTLERLGVDVGLHYLFVALPWSVYPKCVSIQTVSRKNLSDRLQHYFLEDKIHRNIFCLFVLMQQCFKEAFMTGNLNAVHRYSSLQNFVLNCYFLVRV